MPNVQFENTLPESSQNPTKRRIRAILGFLFFIADLAAALWLAYSLYKLCHKKYAMAVIAFVVMPGMNYVKRNLDLVHISVLRTAQPWCHLAPKKCAHGQSQAK